MFNLFNKFDWQQCCERGIAIFRQPKIFQESITVFVVSKTPTFVDRNKWISAYSFPTLKIAQEAVKTGVEPTVYWKELQPNK